MRTNGVSCVTKDWIASLRGIGGAKSTCSSSTEMIFGIPDYRVGDTRPRELGSMIADQSAERVDGFRLVGTAGLDHYRAADARGEQHHGEDIACVCLAPLESERDARREPGGEVDDLRGEPRMETEAAGYVDLTRLHGAHGCALSGRLLQVKCTPTAQPHAPSAWITSTKSRLCVTLLPHTRSNSATRRVSALDPWIAWACTRSSNS